MKNFSRHSMPLALATVALTMLFAFGSCTSAEKKAANRFKEAAKNLDNTQHTLVDEFDYWPECGIRVTGSHLASLISLEEFQSMLPCPLYVSGPHSANSWNLECENDFGHYNPQAISFLGDVAKKVVADKNFVNLTKPLVDKYLYRQMHIMMVLYDAMHDKNLFDEEEYMHVMLNEMIEYGGADWYFLNSLNLEDESYVYGNTGDQFLRFWARRDVDGTMDLFYAVLKTVFTAYYPDYQYTTENYYTPVVYEDDYYDYEEEYWFDDSEILDEERLNKDEAVNLIRDLIPHLDQSYNALGIDDYWPICGIRSTGSHLFSLICLRTLRAMLPCELYVEGPHYIGHWDLENEDEFGRYNPEAVKYLSDLAGRVVADKKFVNNTKPIIDEYLKRQMFISMTLYDAMNDKNICPDRAAVCDNIMRLRGEVYYGDEGPASDFLNAVDINDDTYVYANTGNMYLYFWARRDFDGTADLFYDALKKVYMAYYPEYKYDPASWNK